MPLRMDAELVPRRLRKLDVIVFCGFLDIGESQRTIRVRDVGNLIEPRHGIANVTGIGERLFSLLWKCIDAIGQIALLR